jgi:cytidylate kinase
LGCKSLSREEVLIHARNYGIDETGLAEGGLMEHQPPSLWDRHAPQRRRYLIVLKAALMDFMVEGNVVYHGHLAQFQLYDIPKLLRVKANASMSIRVNTLMKEMGMSEDAAESHIKEIDQRRTNWSKFLYNINSTTRTTTLFSIWTDELRLDGRHHFCRKQ